jgi:hypothetical protein
MHSNCPVFLCKIRKNATQIENSCKKQLFFPAGCAMIFGKDTDLRENPGTHRRI